MIEKREHLTANDLNSLSPFGYSSSPTLNFKFETTFFKNEPAQNHFALRAP